MSHKLLVDDCNDARPDPRRSNSPNFDAMLSDLLVMQKEITSEYEQESESFIKELDMVVNRYKDKQASTLSRLKGAISRITEMYNSYKARIYSRPRISQLSSSGSHHITRVSYMNTAASQRSSNETLLPSIGSSPAEKTVCTIPRLIESDIVDDDTPKKKSRRLLRLLGL